MHMDMSQGGGCCGGANQSDDAKKGCGDESCENGGVCKGDCGENGCSKKEETEMEQGCCGSGGCCRG